MALEAKNKRLFGEDGRAREEDPAETREYARNTCLQAGMCLRHFFGWTHCEHLCDVAFVNEMKEDVFAQLVTQLCKRVPRYEREKALRLIKRVYFGKGEA